jgi:hypothetical protein
MNSKRIAVRVGRALLSISVAWLAAGSAVAQDAGGFIRAILGIFKARRPWPRA